MFRRSIGWFWVGLLSFVFGCKPQPSRKAVNLALGNVFVDAFYSFDRDSLSPLLSNASTSQPEILYYQQWAKCAHYTILDRSHMIVQNDTLVICPVTVKDDLMGALQIPLNITDTFHITIIAGKIHSVTTSSNDIDTYYKAKAWVKTNRPELIEIPCKGIWAGGPTPCECVLGMIEGFKAYIANKKYTLYQ